MPQSIREILNSIESGDHINSTLTRAAVITLHECYDSILQAFDDTGHLSSDDRLQAIAEAVDRARDMLSCGPTPGYLAIRATRHVLSKISKGGLDPCPAAADA